MIGVTISDIVSAVQHEGVGVLRKTRGDMSQVIRHALVDLHDRGIVSAEDQRSLEHSFSDALDVLAHKKASPRMLAPARKRYASMVANRNSSDVARALSELCLSVIADAGAGSKRRSRVTGKGPSRNVAMATATTTISGKGEQALLWGAIGAAVGGSIGGGLGALIGGAVGAAIGSCGDSDTTVTVTNNGGGSPT